VQSHRPAAEAGPHVTGVIRVRFEAGIRCRCLIHSRRRKYGTAEENVVLNPDVPGKWDGIKLLRISF